MTSSSRFASDRPSGGTPSSAFELFDPRIQRWIWQQNWDRLRPIQERAAAPILSGDTDVVIASGTASGKTEAAFLPIFSRIAGVKGLAVLAISPLKALINDQYDRLGELGAAVEVPVHRWHGDVSANHKQRVLQRPSGVLLITPESLEALFILRGSTTARLFADLQYGVIDELHAFIGSERGVQLQSLLHRVEQVVARRISRIALSATLGDMPMACDYLRPGHGTSVTVVQDTETPQGIRLLVRGYRKAPEAVATVSSEPADDVTPAGSTGDADQAVAQDLYETLRGGRHLAFANSRSDVEQYTDLLRRMCECDRVPVEFWPHHGNLSKELREDAEAALKEGTRPATVLATTTLELGIDVGSVESIAQIGPPPSVAALRQRLGRSGRRHGTSSTIRIYIQESEIGPTTTPVEMLRPGLVQTVAMVRLLVERWNEPPEPTALHLSTLVQQVLSVVAQHGAVSPIAAWRLLCGTGPFGAVDRSMFAQFLRSLAAHDLLTQTHDGALVLGLTGERLVNHYDFYAAFFSPEEYRLVAGSRTLGSLPLVMPVIPDMFLIFGGRRWVVLAIDDERKLIDVAPAAAGRAPRFSGGRALVHDRVRQEMLAVYQGVDEPPFLDPSARRLLAEGRDWFRRFGLGEQSMVSSDRGTLIFPWVGDRIMNTLLVQLSYRGLRVAQMGIALWVEGIMPAELRPHLDAIAEAGPADARVLAEAVPNIQTQKHHKFLPDTLLAADYAASYLDTVGAWETARRLTAVGPTIAT